MAMDKNKLAAEQGAPNTDGAVDPFDPSRFRVSEILSTGGDGIRKEITHIRTGKPPKSVFFRSHPDPEYSIDCFMLEDDSGGGMRETYLVLPQVAEALIEEVKAKRIKLCVTRQGVPFLWEIARPLDDGFGRRNLWHETALKAAELSETKWTRVAANMSEGAYTIHTSESMDEPQWPDPSIEALLRLGYGEERVVRDMQHPLVRRLLGQD
ncbi:hypothetical protein MWU53_14885 [Aliiroseovarius sp. S1123]|uniref:hypothetical protein n=1 Tax=Aliiroseovarius sp. S1123 TaxID=2926404 RepID=UPI001FF5693B|nr:hypothetical protein [Aliiroseovarius sp. S1123]MCK0172347.1 hypothetical protein [Aliiroseovarius sp. S1123]